jgi:uncharacterized membrane protein affecting hemolysin expression
MFPTLRFRTRLYLVYICLVFLGVLSISSWWFHLEEQRMVNEVRDYLSGSVRLMAISVEDELNKDGWSTARIQPLAKRLGKTVHLRVTIIDK